MSEIRPRPITQKEGPRYVNHMHLRYVRTLACFICGIKPVEVHHTLFPERTSRGMGRKAGDDEVVPVCAEHHRQAHRGRKSWNIKYGEQEREEIRLLRKMSPYLRKDE